MDLYINRDDLSRGLARIQSIVERRSTQPVLSHVLLGAHEGGLRVTATDTEVAYIGDLPANVEEDGELAVDATHLFQVIRTLPDPTVRLVGTSGHRVEITSGRAFFRLPGLPADEYPALPAFDAQGEARLSEAQLQRMVEQTSFAVATDDARYGLNGAYLEERTRDDERWLRMVATDGHRLSAAEARVEGQLAITPRMLVPRKAMQVMKKLLDGGDELVTVSFGEGAIRLSRTHETFWFRMLDGEFPDYNAVVPSESRFRAMVQRSEFSSTLRRVAVLVQNNTRPVRFALSEGEAGIHVHNIDRGEVKEVLPLEYEGEPVEVGFNVRYLQDVLGVLAGDRVKLELAHHLAPCLITNPDQDDAFFVIMPMRLD